MAIYGCGHYGVPIPGAERPGHTANMQTFFRKNQVLTY